MIDAASRRRVAGALRTGEAPCYTTSKPQRAWRIIEIRKTDH
jgi:hypothetical protein